jgi:16S rRNA (guanine527-N7)-methyltransferase
VAALETLEVGSAPWRRLLVDGACELGLALDQAQVERLSRHAAALLRWGRSRNITAITEPLAVAVKHYLDSLAAAPEIPARGRLLDIGSGGGFPGIPLGVIQPGLEGLLLDAVRQKASFLAHAIAVTGLHGWRARQGRAEHLAGEQACRQGFDVVVCRALTGLDRFYRLAKPLVGPGGVMVALKGPEGEGELALLAPQLAREGSAAALRKLRLPILGQERLIITIRSTAGCGPTR